MGFIRRIWIEAIANLFGGVLDILLLYSYKEIIMDIRLTLTFTGREGYGYSCSLQRW